MKAPDGLPPPLFAQPLLHWLANVISARASSELTTVEQALSLKPPKRGNFRIIEWDRHMIDRPVFPEWTRNGPTDKTRSPDSWSDEVSKWAKRAGLTNGTGLHAPRREALIKCNGTALDLSYSYSLGQVLRFASQHNTHVLVNHYLGNMSTIDGAGTYLNMRPRTDLVEDFRSATMRWNPGLYLSLSAKDKEELEGSLEYKAVTRGINELSTRIREATTEDEKQQLKYQRRLEYDRRKAIENKRLREIQAAQKIIYDRGDDPHEQHDWRQIHFDRISHMLPPERLRLAKSMTSRAWPRSSEWVSVLKDLIALRENNDNAAYQEVMRIPPAERWQHAYDCHESYYKATSSFAKFCFHCSKWVAGQGEWKHHCQSHIDSGDIPFRCDPIVFRHAVACAGYCPVHLGRQDLPAHQRMTQYVDKSSWKRHLSDCLPAYIMGQDPSNFACPHTLCPAVFNSSDDLWHHLEDVHSVPKPKTSPLGKRKTPPEPEVTAAKRRITVLPQRSSVLGNPYGVGTAPSDNIISLPRGQPLQVDSNDPATLLCSVSGNGYTECGFEYFEPLAEADADLLDFATLASPASAADRTTPTISGADLQECVDPDILSSGSTQAQAGSAVDASDLDSDAPPSQSSRSYFDADDLQSSEPEYPIECLLAMWKSQRSELFLVKWVGGSTSWEPEMNVPDQSIAELKRTYRGFRDGIEILQTQVRGKALWYKILFLNFDGADEDRSWWVPEKAMDPEVRVKRETKNKRRRRKHS
ncbi:carbonic anhydrase [Purpureocillium lilacinum]|uniref:Carbonic anhydrase n=1 Tax=Purpureocillium lilacinum TaxID=33203 RepID=A0A179FFP5_PURLI|nr:carbonic anhydrase [Purpureocillium lilacinum]OAQ63869.1 carbonic anhydrase [Purpureocillium lilacinum]